MSIYVTGRDLDQLAVRAGQYFQWRFLTRDGWWRAHPFSISSAPNGRWLRITVKELGDWSKQLQHIRPGTRVAVEGPYGVLTGARRTRRRRAHDRRRDRHHAAARRCSRRCPASPGEMILLYRAQPAADVVFRDELDALAQPARDRCPLPDRAPRVARDAPRPARAATARDARPGHHRPRRLRLRAGPDDAAPSTRRCAALRVPTAQVHAERFAY